MSHYYTATGELVEPWAKGAYPSPSTILDIVNSGEGQAFRNIVGDDAADEFMVAAQKRGTRVHKACELWAMGKRDPLDTLDAESGADLQPGEAAYLLGFINWWNLYNPELISTELFLSNEKLKYRGTCDLIVRIDGQLWLIDLKTGMTRTKHGLQVKFYQEALRDMTKRGVGPLEKLEPIRMAGLYLDAKRACGYRYSKSPFGLYEYTEPLSAIKAHLAVFKWWAKKQPTKKPVEPTSVWAPNDLPVTKETVNA